MLPKSQLQFVKSLQQKKYRKEANLFIVEGLKSITEFLYSNYVIHQIFYISNIESKIGIFPKNSKLICVSEKELRQMSGLTTPQGIIALVEIPANVSLHTTTFKNQFTLVLDHLQDPGNLGTIIRTADWFGIKHIICSPNTVDSYNPKVVQATMGSLARVQISYTDLTRLFQAVELPVFAAQLDGQSIYKANFGHEGFVLLGNEGNGINPSLNKAGVQAITIPRLGHAESLNVAISAAIFCSEIKGQSLRVNKR